MKKTINVVFCLAGEGSRFIAENYTIPKYLLNSKAKTILHEIIYNINKKEYCSFYFIINSRHKKYLAQINDTIKQFNIDFDIIITDDTRGQAHTAYIACKKINNNNPVFIFNGDTIIINRDLNFMTSQMTDFKISGYIDAFKSKKSHFSYVIIDDNLELIQIKEKIVVSDLATSGLYAFVSANLYRKYYKKLKTDKEEYISDVYNKMLSDNLRIKINIAENDSDTIVLGTPVEYKKWLND
tara:strand:+ start:1776 stop:2495 length:720 start_codon:yes stop_codon:yes gene_type:complete